MVRTHQALGRALLGVAHRVAGMDTDIAEPVQATVAVAGYDNRTAVGVKPEVTAILAEPGHMVCGHPWPGKDPFPFGSEDRTFLEQIGIRYNLAVLAELFAESGDAGW